MVPLSFLGGFTGITKTKANFTMLSFVIGITNSLPFSPGYPVDQYSIKGTTKEGKDHDYHRPAVQAV